MAGAAGDEGKAIEATRSRLFDRELPRLAPRRERPSKTALVEFLPSLPVQGTGQRPLLRIAGWYIVGAGDRVGRDRLSRRQFDLPDHKLTGLVDTPLRILSPIDGVIDGIAVAFLMATGRGHTNIAGGPEFDV